jgi:hypothetical protein
MLLTTDLATDDAFTRAATFSFFFLMIALNCVWLAIKGALWSGGRRPWFNLDDLRELKLIAARQENSSKRVVYDALWYTWHACFVLMFLVPLTLLGIGYLISRAH